MHAVSSLCLPRWEFEPQVSLGDQLFPNLGEPCVDWQWKEDEQSGWLFFSYNRHHTLDVAAGLIRLTASSLWLSPNLKLNFSRGFERRLAVEFVREFRVVEGQKHYQAFAEQFNKLV